MKALDSNPEPLPNFDTLAPIADMDEESESDDGVFSCPECSSESSDEEIPRETNEYNWHKRSVNSNAQ